jgi:FkbM family methyltransferase
MDNKKKIFFFDVYKSGLEFIKPIFDHDKVEICGLFTTDGVGGVNISEIGNYQGWDYIVTTFTSESYEAIRKLLSNLRVKQEKIIFITHDEIKSESLEQVNELLDFGYRKAFNFENGRREYRERVMGDYGLLTVEGVSYINSASDSYIMPAMYTSQNNFAKDTILDFYRTGNEMYTFSDKQNVFCDIGANIGTTSIYVKKRLDKDVKILAFEPSKVNYKLLRINMLLNDIEESDFVLVNAAVSDNDGEAMFEFNEENPGASSLIVNEGTANKEMVRVTSFDNYIEENKIDIETIKYIWIDIEGFEPAFFRGAEKTLSRINVPIIIEFSPELYKKTGVYEDFMATLKRLYSSFIITQEEVSSTHDISELTKYENLGQQVDIMLMK